MQVHQNRELKPVINQQADYIAETERYERTNCKRWTFLTISMTKKNIYIIALL